MAKSLSRPVPHPVSSTPAMCLAKSLCPNAGNSGETEEKSSEPDSLPQWGHPVIGRDGQNGCLHRLRAGCDRSGNDGSGFPLYIALLHGICHFDQLLQEI
jgi:hypothetical protein